MNTNNSNNSNNSNNIFNNNLIDNNKINLLLNKLENIKEKYPNFANIWREYLKTKINHLNIQIDKLEKLLENMDDIDNDIPVFLLFMLINN